MKLLHLILYSCFLVVTIDAYKILLIFSMPAKSLSIIGEAYVKHLLKAGHEVTYVTTYPTRDELGMNFRQIDVSAIIDRIGMLNNEVFNIKYLIEHTDVSFDQHAFYQIGVDQAQYTLVDPNFMEVVYGNERFDLVIADLYGNDVLAGLAALYECPMVWSYSLGLDWLATQMLAESTNPAYTADPLASANVPPFFWHERAEELWYQLKGKFIRMYHIRPRELQVYENFFKPLFQKHQKPLPAFEELVHNTSLMFGNVHHAFGNLPSTPQNFKMIGGMHIDNPPKPLPVDLQKLLDSKGFIYFSMGSVFLSNTIPPTIIQDLLKMFSSLPVNIIWKFEDDLPNVPENVHILNWAPQQSILAHEKCLVFVTQGGMLSSTEALHFGVPIIGIPLYFDQNVNINRAVKHGYAIRVPMSYDLANDLKEAVDTIFNTPNYRDKAHELSAVYHHRPVAPDQEMVHWVQHVIQTKGAPHLRSPALLHPWYERYYLDLLAVAIGLAFLIYKATIQRIMKSRKRSSKKKTY